MLENFAKDPTLAEAVVQNPNCPPEILERLRLYSRGMEKLVVKNPNTPKHLLLKLGERHPKEFLQNPILLLITLEEPDFWAKAPDDFVEKILARSDAPFETICQSLMTSLLNKRDGILLPLAGHPNTPQETLLQLAGCWRHHIRWKASKHPNLPRELSEVARAEFLRVDLTDETVHSKLYHDEVPAFLSVEVLRLCARGGPWLRYVAASDQNTPGEVLEQLALDPDPQVRGVAIANPSQTPEALHRLLDTSPLHADIAKNPSASGETLCAVWAMNQQKKNPHIDHATRLFLSKNPSTPEKILRELYELKVPEYLQGLTQNPSCPKELLQFFEGQLDVLEFLVLNPALSKESLCRLATSTDDAVRRNAAKNPSLPKDCLEKLARDPNPEVRKQVAARVDLPAELQVLLALDGNTSVQKVLLRAKERRSKSYLKK